MKGLFSFLGTIFNGGNHKEREDQLPSEKTEKFVSVLRKSHGKHFVRRFV